MTDKNLLLLLQIIKNNRSIKQLTRENLSFRKITNLTNIAIENGYLSYENEKVTVTEKGNTLLEEEEHLIKKVNKNEWIDKDLKNKIPKLDKNVLFLPNQNELPF